MEWVGIVLGLSVPLLLINKVENSRQQHLVAGLALVALIALSSALAAALNKFAIDAQMTIGVAFFYATMGISTGSLLLITYKQCSKGFKRHLTGDTTVDLVVFASLRAVLICASFACVLFAYQDGSLGVVQTIHSFYILIPIVLAVIFYQEHWSLQKLAAVVLSIAALAFLH